MDPYINPRSYVDRYIKPRSYVDPYIKFSESGFVHFWKAKFCKVGAFGCGDVFIACFSVCWCVLECFGMLEMFFLKNLSRAGWVPAVTLGPNTRRGPRVLRWAFRDARGSLL